MVFFIKIGFTACGFVFLKFLITGEEDGIITRTVYPEVPPRVEYALSELGESMRTIIGAMEQWGISYKNTANKA